MQHQLHQVDAVVAGGGKRVGDGLRRGGGRVFGQGFDGGRLQCSQQWDHVLRSIELPSSDFSSSCNASGIARGRKSDAFNAATRTSASSNISPLRWIACAITRLA